MDMRRDMMYEELMCEIFNCSQDEDPLVLASADVFEGMEEIEDGEGFELRLGILSAIRRLDLDCIKGKYPNDEFYYYNQQYLIEFNDTCFKTTSTDEINRILDVLRDFLDNMKKQ